MFVKMKDEASITFKTLADSFEKVFNSAISSVSNGITGLVMGTMSWSQFLAKIPLQIMTSIVGAIVEMGVRWVAVHVLMQGAEMALHALAVALGWTRVAQYTAQETTKASAGKVIATAGLAAALPIAAGYSLLWAAPATLATIASDGGAALAAPGLIAFAEAMTMMTAAFDVGGYTGGKRGEPAGIVHGEEFVFSAPAVDRIGLPTLQAMHSGSTAAGSRSSGGGAFGGAGRAKRSREVKPKTRCCV